MTKNIQDFRFGWTGSVVLILVCLLPDHYREEEKNLQEGLCLRAALLATVVRHGYIPVLFAVL